MQERHVSFEEVTDIIAFRIITRDIDACYRALGLLHRRWKMVPGRFKDYISLPKFNMYQSLHTTVVGPQGKPVEIQIRTHLMHRRAEYGVAAHWKYKEDRGTSANRSGGGDTPANDMVWLRQLLDWQKETADPGEFLDSLRFEMNAGEVFVFTPKGEVIALPAGSTPIDFAYAVHTEVGHHCVGARVNGRLVALDRPLENGDAVEVLTSRAEGAGPSRDWLDIVRSPRARNKIREWFTKERREEMVEAGKDGLARAMRQKNLPLQRLTTVESLTAVAGDLGLKDIESLYAAMGENHVSPQHVVERLVAVAGGEAGATEDLAEATIPRAEPRRPRDGDPGVTVRGMDDVLVKLARCCTPVPGDSIMGYITRGNGVSVHRTDCTNADSLRSEPDRITEVSWTSSQGGSVFLVQLQVEALDRAGLLSDITRALSEAGVNILEARVHTSRDRVAVSNFTFEMGDATHLDHVIRSVRRVDAVFDAYRVTGRRSPPRIGTGAGRAD